MSEVVAKPVKVEFIESYIKGPNGSADYQWNDNHGELIRCKDCIHFTDEGILTNCYRHNGISPDYDWFCADGVKKDG